MTDIITTAAEIAQGYTEDDAQALGAQSYPSIQWMHGKKELKQLGSDHPQYTGGWFAPQAQIERLDLTPEALAAWQEGSVTYGNGDEEAGWMCRDLTMSVIAWRRAWEVRLGRRVHYLPWSERNSYDRAKAMADSGNGYVTGRLKVLVVPQGWPVEEPVTLTLHGTAGREFFNAMALAQRNILQPFAKASKIKHGRIPFRMFWLTIGPQRTADGQPAFVKVGEAAASSWTTPPALIGVTEKLTVQEIVKLFVDADAPKERVRLTAFDALWNDPATQEWVHAWDTEAEPAEEEATAASEDDFAPLVDEEPIPF